MRVLQLAPRNGANEIPGGYRNEWPERCNEQVPGKRGHQRAMFRNGPVMRQQIAFVEKRDGSSAAHQYALQTLRAYRSAAQFRNDANQRHFAHDRIYRRFFVVAICEIRDYLQTDHGPSAIPTERWRASLQNQLIGGYCGSACVTSAADVMTADVTLLPANRLPARRLVGDGETRIRAYPRHRRGLETIGGDQRALRSDRVPEQPTDRSAPAPAPAPEPTNPSGSGRRERATPEGDDLDPTRYGDWEKNGRCIDF